MSDIFDFHEVACHNGHITIDAHNYECGGKYQYNGIISKKDKEMYPRKESTYLKYMFLKDVVCDVCKEKLLTKLRKK